MLLYKTRVVLLHLVIRLARMATQGHALMYGWKMMRV